ncbi:MAG: phosphomethylpyrimidine synthase ThiC [Candidatus Bathyarchaeia archaeon]
MTQMKSAKRGHLTEEMKEVARAEGVSPEHVMRGVGEGRIVIARNPARGGERKALGIGEGLRVKVNANVGTSPDICDPDLEVRKARIAEGAGADSVMDLSTGGDLDLVRRMILEKLSVAVGTVPIYQAAIEAQRKKGAIIHMDEDDIFEAIERHAKDGVDFVTVHCGVTKASLRSVMERGRLLGIVSRGGTFTAAWMMHHGKENPLYENYDYLLDIAEEYDLVLSLGDGLRPGCIADATDGPQIHELLIIGELVERARRRGVQAMVEGPGHIPLNQIEANVRLEKAICKGAPFYVLGPVVTDVAPGYDHFVSAIGGAIAALAGADFLCYVTPAEHIGLPTEEDVREGVMVARIAAHAADLARMGKFAEWDRRISEARRDLDWAKQIELAIDPERAKRMRSSRTRGEQGTCSMCGEYCAIKILKDYVRAEH